MRGPSDCYVPDNTVTSNTLPRFPVPFFLQEVEGILTMQMPEHFHIARQRIVRSRGFAPSEQETRDWLVRLAMRTDPLHGGSFENG